MKVLMTGGGTAGHITPILSVATELKKAHPKVHIRYVGQAGDSLASIAVENELISGSWLVLAGKWRRYHGVGFWTHARDWRTVLKNIRDLFLLGLGFMQSIWLLLRWRPDVVFAKGGFVCVPVGLAAALLRVPIVTHDSDALPGLTNRILARFARKQCVGLPVQYYKQYDQRKVVQTGVPINDKYHAVTSAESDFIKAHLQLPKDAKVVTVFGGSLGAIRINNAFLETVPTLLEKIPELYIFHITGSQQSEEIALAYGSLRDNLRRRIWSWPFVKNLDELTAVADVVVSRSGATSLAELGAQRKAVILVPNPYLTGGHQTYNARLVAEQNAALVVTEKQIHDDITILEETIALLLMSKKQQDTLGDNLSKMIVPNAAANIAKILSEVAA